MDSPDETIDRSADSDCTLVILAKAPEPGRVKTRLAQSLPSLAVGELCRCLLADTVKLARSLGEVEVVILCPASDVEAVSRATGESVPVLAQAGEGLAAAIASAFARLTLAGKRRVIALGTDSPHLPAPVLRSAFQSLTACDLVVGPTLDGGYYLVGAQASHPRLFADDGMGTTTALQTLLARARTLGLAVRLLEPFYDIDVPADLVRLAEELHGAPQRAPKTAEWLRRWGRAVAQRKHAREGS